MLVEQGAIADGLRAQMLGWRHSGFPVHNAVRLVGDDTAGRQQPAGYMIRVPMSLEKMRYDAASGSAIYRSKMYPGLKRNFQAMPGGGEAGAAMPAHPDIA